MKYTVYNEHSDTIYKASYIDKVVPVNGNLMQLIDGTGVVVTVVNLAPGYILSYTGEDQ